MDFKEATGRLMDAGLTAGDLAEALGLAPQTVRAMRLDPSSSSYRNPPEGWRKAFGKLARERGGRLLELAREFEEGASE
jgi:hypothetical protein